MPTLQFHEKPLYESNVICELLEEAYPGYGRSLLPKDLYDRARMRIWQDYITSRIIPSYHRFLQHQPSSNGGSDEGLHNARKDFQGHIVEFTKEMEPTGPFFMGNEPQMIDFIMAPWAIRIWVFEHFKHIPGVPPEGNGGQDEATWARWRKFQSAIESLKSIQDTTSEREKYLSIYQKYADDKVSRRTLTSSLTVLTKRFRLKARWPSRFALVVVWFKTELERVSMNDHETYCLACCALPPLHLCWTSSFLSIDLRFSYMHDICKLNYQSKALTHGRAVRPAWKNKCGGENRSNGSSHAPGVRRPPKFLARILRTYTS